MATAAPRRLSKLDAAALRLNCLERAKQTAHKADAVYAVAMQARTHKSARAIRLSEYGAMLQVVGFYVNMADLALQRMQEP